MNAILALVTTALADPSSHKVIVGGMGGVKSLIVLLRKEAVGQMASFDAPLYAASIYIALFPLFKDVNRVEASQSACFLCGAFKFPHPTFKEVSLEALSTM